MRWTVGDVVTRRRDGKRFKIKSLGVQNRESVPYRKPGKGPMPMGRLISSSGPELLAEDGEEIKFNTWGCGILGAMFIPAQQPYAAPVEKLLPEYYI